MDKKRSHMIDILFVLFVLLGSAWLSLLLIAAGTGVYRNLLARADQNEALRTPVAYVTQKVRSHDVQGGISVTELDGREALTLRAEVAGTPCITYLYTMDGMLRELFVPESAPPLPATAGKDVTPCEEMRFSLERNALHITVREKDAEARYLLHCLGAEGGVP